jgi:hypothetical protein
VVACELVKVEHLIHFLRHGFELVVGDV